MTLKKEKNNEVTKKRNCEITEQVIRHNLVERAHVITTEIQRELHSCSDVLKRQIQFEHRWNDEKQRASESQVEYILIQQESKSMELANRLEIDQIKLNLQDDLHIHFKDAWKAKNLSFLDSRIHHNQLASNLKDVASDVSDYNRVLGAVGIAHFVLSLQFKKEFYCKKASLQEEFKQKYHNLTRKSDKNVETIQGALERRIDSVLSNVDKYSNMKIAQLTQTYEDKLESQRIYFKRKLQGQLVDIGKLKMDLIQKGRRFVNTEERRKNTEIRSIALKEPFKIAKEYTKRLESEIACANKHKHQVSLEEDELKAAEDSSENFKWRNEILTQRLELLNKEKNQKQEQLNEAILSLKQRKKFMQTKLCTLIDSLQDLSDKVPRYRRQKMNQDM